MTNGGSSGGAGEELRYRSAGLIDAASVGRLAEMALGRAGAAVVGGARCPIDVTQDLSKPCERPSQEAGLFARVARRVSGTDRARSCASRSACAVGGDA